jgi:hypothetical protein
MLSNHIKSAIKKEKETENNDQCNPLDIDAILEASENVDEGYLGQYTAKGIAKENYETLCEIYSDSEDITTVMCKLKDYRLIEFVYLLRKGKHIRWIRNGKLTNGGILVDVTFPENGTQILCKCGRRFIKYRMDDCNTFQKLTTDEQLILQAKDYAIDIDITTV